MKKIAFIVFLLLSCNLSAQSSAQALVEKSIAFHDPEGNWNKFSSSVDIESIVVRNGDTTTSSRKLLMDIGKNYFMMQQDTVVYEYPCEDCERATMYNNYFRYLLGLPMKLKDPGIIIHDEVEMIAYKGSSYQVVTVGYEPEVGSDTWKFYFDPVTYKLIIAEFSKDGTFESGETIELNDKVRFQQMLLPGQLLWLVLPDREFLAEENITYSEFKK